MAPWASMTIAMMKDQVWRGRGTNYNLILMKKKSKSWSSRTRGKKALKSVLFNKTVSVNQRSEKAKASLICKLHLVQEAMMHSKRQLGTKRKLSWFRSTNRLSKTGKWMMWWTKSTTTSMTLMKTLHTLSTQTLARVRLKHIRGLTRMQTMGPNSWHTATILRRKMTITIRIIITITITRLRERATTITTVTSITMELQIKTIRSTLNQRLNNTTTTTAITTTIRTMKTISSGTKTTRTRRSRIQQKIWWRS